MGRSFSAFLLTAKSSVLCTPLTTSDTQQCPWDIGVVVLLYRDGSEEGDTAKQLIRMPGRM